MLFDNKADADEMQNHKNRTEFQKAEKYGAGECSRYSDTLSEKTIYYALRMWTLISDADSIRNHGICDIKKDRKTCE